MKNSLILIAFIMIFSGCSAKEYFTLGENQSICEEEGCDYSDAGVCLNPIDILKNKPRVKYEAYRNIREQ